MVKVKYIVRTLDDGKFRGEALYEGVTITIGPYESMTKADKMIRQLIDTLISDSIKKLVIDSLNRGG